MSQSYFAQVSPGLEESLKDELKTFKARKLKQTVGGIEFLGTRKHLYQMLIWSRFASRLYLTLGSWQTPNPHALFQKVSKIEWGQILNPSDSICIRVHLSRSPGLAGSGQVEDLIRTSLHRQRPLAPPPSFSWSDSFKMGQQRMLVHIDQHQCTVRLDASGTLMHRRGWRHNDGPAPIRATLASILLHRLGWTPSCPLIDPFCGSGTFLVEAGRQIIKKPAGLPTLLRPCQSWSHFDQALWSSFLPVLDQSLNQDFTHPPLLYGCDLSPSSIALTQTHLTNAHIPSNLYTLATQSIDHFADLLKISSLNDVSSNGYVVANPPYGKRVSHFASARHALHTLLDQFKSYPPQWILGVVLPIDQTPPQKGLKRTLLCQFKHGGLDVGWWKFTRN